MESKMILKDLGPAGLRGVRCKGGGVDSVSQSWKGGVAKCGQCLLNNYSVGKESQPIDV